MFESATKKYCVETGYFLFLLVLLFVSSPLKAQEIEYYSNPIEKTIYSQSFLKDRNITLVLPSTFNKKIKKRYPLIIVFDRQNKSIFKQICESIIYLNRFDEIPEVIIAGVTSDSKDRTLETTFKREKNGGKAEEMTHFIFNELVPWCEKNYNTGSCRILIGHSRFGYFTSALMCSQKESITGIISLSPFFYQENLSVVDSVINTFSESEVIKNSIYYRFVTGDSLDDTADYSKMKKALTKAKMSPMFNWEGYAFYNAKHNVVPGLGVMPSLLSIFDSWSTIADSLSPLSPYVKLSNPLIFKTSNYFNYLKATKLLYGDEINLGLARLNGLGSDFFNKKDFKMAHFFWNELVKNYPFYSPVYIDLAEVFLAENRKNQAIKVLNIGLKSLNNNKFLPKELNKKLRINMNKKLFLLKM